MTRQERMRMRIEDARAAYNRARLSVASAGLTVPQKHAIANLLEAHGKLIAAANPGRSLDDISESGSFAYGVLETVRQEFV